MQLIRIGGTITGYRSTNGSTWTQAGSAAIALSGTPLIGLAVTGHNDSQLNATTFDNVLVSPATPTAAWQLAMFGPKWNNATIAGDAADPDNDGANNLLERALNGNANANDPAPLAQPGIVTGRLALTFTRSTANTDLTLTAQAADTPAGPWTDLARSTSGAAFTVLAVGSTAIETGTGPTRTVEIRDLYPITDPSHPRRFLRVQVQH